MFEFNGKKIIATDLTSRFLDSVTRQVKQEFGERFRSIRHPKTGEFPTVVVYGNSLSDLSLKIEGSEELIEHIKSKLPEEETTHVNFVARRKILTPKVFLSFGWEDHDLAGKIANELMRQGIDTWWADWEIKAGDSIRRRIDEGLGRCTHFLVLLSPNSIDKPWVKEEMDAGFTRMLDDACTFLPLRYNLSHEQLPQLLKGRLSPEVSDDLKLTQLINDIHGISRKPQLGKSPIDQNLPDTGFSVAATTIAKVFCAEYTQAMGQAQAVYAATGGNVQFVGHSLGGGLATASAIVTGGSATVFNAAGVNPSTVGGASPVSGSITHFQSSFDGLQMLNSVTPVKTYGEQILLGPAGWHPMGGVCERVRC